MFSSVKVELFVNEVDKVFAKDGPSPFAPIFSDFSVPFVPKAFAKAIPPSVGCHLFIFQALLTVQSLICKNFDSQ